MNNQSLPPPIGGEPDLSQSMSGMSLGQQLPAPRAKRPARVFHTEFSTPLAPAAPYGNHEPPLTAPRPHYNDNEFTSPMDGALGSYRLGSPMDSAVAAHRMGSPYQQQQQPQPQQTSSHLSETTYRQAQDQAQAYLTNSHQGNHFSGGPGVARDEASNALIPSISADRANAQKSLGPAPIFKTFENAAPPCAGTDYDVQDQGLSGPQFARLTMYNVPNSENLRSLTKLPLGLVLRPFAPFSNKEYESGGISVADFSEGVAPPRCRRCRAYMNPSMLFIEGGTKFICNHCQFANEVSGEYFQPTDASNRRIDWQTRPELAFGTYDMIVSEDYWKQAGMEPSPLHHLVLIDVSRDAIKKEIPHIAVEAIRAALYGGGFSVGEEATKGFSNEETLAYDENGNPVDPASIFSRNISYPSKGKIGIATYDGTVQFYNLNASLEQAQMIVMSDITDSFVPLEEGLFVDPEESRYVIEDLLDRIDSLFADNPLEEPVFGCALDVALKALKSTGGKVSAMLTSLPSRGPGSLAIRDGNLNFSGDKEKHLFKADSKFYEDLGKEYALAGVGLDLFLFPTSSIDLANTGIVCQFSGGHEHFYPRFVPQRDGRRFIADFCRSCEGEIATEAQLKVRSSTGLQVAAYYGNFYHDGWEDEPRFGTLDSRTTIGVMFKYDGKLDSKLDVHFQSALLYTSSAGQRCVRVINIIASVTEQFRPVINFVDMDACLGIIARDSVARMGELSLADIRNRLSDRLVDVFVSYRKHVASSLPPNQLLMPISLRAFIVQLLALQKSRPLRDQKLISDARTHAARIMRCLTPDELSLFLYPRIIGLHNLQPTDCTYTPNGLFNMPTNVTASMTALDPGGVYLTFNGRTLLLWIHTQVSPALLTDLFGDQATDLQALDPYLNELPELDTDVSIKARALIKYFANKCRTRFLGLQLARQGLDGADYEFQASMVEDTGPGAFRYSEFVMHIHRDVKNRLEHGKEKTSRSNFLTDRFFS